MRTLSRSVTKWLGVVAAAGVVWGLGGCIIVVDHDSDTCWDSEAHLARGCLGVNLERPGAATAAQLGLDRERASLVTRVYAGSSADLAGLKTYDVITRIDGDEHASPGRVRGVIRSHKGGEEIRLTVMREGKPVEVVATLRD